MTRHAEPAKPLGDFELIVLLASIRLWDDAYGAEILREIEAHTGRTITSGALYITLDRLEAKGYIKSALRNPAGDRAGRPRRYITVTSKGVAAVRESRTALLSLMDGLDTVLG
jgi:PadR family transcriptional regulator PadR